MALAPFLVAAAPARYNDTEAPSPRAPLVQHIEELARKLAAEAHRPPLDIDPRLEQAAVEIARRAPPTGPPPNDLVEGALWLRGIVEPPPQLIVVTTGRDSGEAALLDELRAQLPRVLGSGSYRRVGVAAEPVDAETHVVVALQESFVELEPIPRALPAGGAAAIKGKLRPPYVRAEVLMTAPGGKVTPLFAAARDEVTHFTATLRCLAVGRHQVEILGDDRYGPSVLANFPVDCGVPAPSEMVGRGSPRESDKPVTDARQAEVAVAALVAADRARAGLPVLKLDAALSAVARAHSDDMVRHHFFGHVSPSTGSAADRLKAAHLVAQLVLENVARAYSPGEVERGLMGSPGHRANLLSPEVTDLGVGVTLGPDDGQTGAREIFVTQLFIRAPAPLPRDAADELKRRIAELRGARGLAPLAIDADLEKIAVGTAVELARRGTINPRPQDDDPLRHAEGVFAQRYRKVRSAAAAATDLPEAVQSLERPLVDAATVAMGVGVARAGDSVYVVVLLGNR